MIEEKFLIKPSVSLGKDVSTVMINRKFFDLHIDSEKGEESIHSLVSSQIPFPIVWLKQVHGTKVHEVNEIKSEVIKKTDGFYTRCPNIVLAIKTADCLPLILSNENGSEIAALHVGWRGLSKGIIEKALSCYDCDLKKVNAWLGPSISPKKYVVGEDVFCSFIEADNESISSFQVTEKKDKWFFDLKNESMRRLKNYGINSIYSDFCTYTDEELFYSHRREVSYKRMVTLVWRDNEK